MFDKIAVQTVTIEIDRNGKLWVNVDDVCVVRIGRIANLTITDERKANKGIAT